MRSVRCLLLILLASALAGCPVCRAAPPDALVRKGQVPYLLEPIAAAFSSGFGPQEIATVARELDVLPPNRDLTLEFPDVVFQGRAFAAFWIHIGWSRSGAREVQITLVRGHGRGSSFDVETQPALRALVPPLCRP